AKENHPVALLRYSEFLSRDHIMFRQQLVAWGMCDGEDIVITSPARERRPTVRRLPDCRRRRGEIADDTLERRGAPVFCGEQTLDVLHHEDHRLIPRDDA